MKVRKHLRMLPACAVTAVLTFIYYQLTQYGEFRITAMSAVWIIAFTGILFAAAELARLLVMKLFPKLAAGEKKHFLGMMIGVKEITCILCCLVLAVLSFLPLILDTVSPSAPFESTSKAVMDTGIGATGLTNVGPITKEIVVYQTFECPCQYLRALEFKAETFDRVNESTLFVDLCECDTVKLFEKWEIDERTLKQGDPIYLEITNPELLSGTRGRDFMLRIYSRDAVADTGISLYCTENDTYDTGEGPMGKLYIVEDIPEGDLLMKVYGNDKPENYESVRTWLCVFTAAVSCMTGWALLYGKKKTKEKKAEEI